MPHPRTKAKAFDKPWHSQCKQQVESDENLMPERFVLMVLCLYVLDSLIMIGYSSLLYTDYKNVIPCNHVQVIFKIATD